MLEATQVIDMPAIGQRARAASVALARLSTAQKNAVLRTMADKLEAARDEILAVNAQDIADARANGVDAHYIKDRLDLERRMPDIIADVRKVAELTDPVGQEIDAAALDNGLRVTRRRTPLGVLGVIYEARPQVTVDVVSLAIKTGNAVVLRGGSDVLRSNMALVRVLQAALEAHDVPADAILYIESTDRRYVNEMLRLSDYIDMIIPRGGSALHQLCIEQSTIPVITGGIGICHLYADASVDIDRALPVIHNAKTQRPAVCNALDTLLVHASVAADFLPRVVDYLGTDGVAFRACPRAFAIVGADDRVTAAGPDDFDTEWYALILGLKVVDDLDEAITHVREHSTQHSDGILTADPENAARFLNEVDSAAVYVNASTRFTDGSAFGLGAEIAVSTQKLHARGPVALEGLTTYKWVVEGDYHSR